MYQVGSLLKKIREDKGISQSQLADNFISRVALSKIENDKVIPKFNTLAFILDQLSVSFDEFIFLLGSEGSKNSIINKFWSISDNTETKKLKDFVKECDLFLEKNEDLFIKDLRILAKALLFLPDLSVTSIPKETIGRIEPIWDRINKMNLWTLSELKLAACIIFYYPKGTALNIASRIEKELIKYEEYAPVKTFILGEYLNLTTIYMNSESFELAKQINDHALSLSKDLNRFDIYYFCIVRKGIFNKNEKLVSKGLDILRQLDKEDYVEFLVIEVNNLLKK
ncbi:hypothetical protein A5881_003607 [Enterococcus termitis]